MEPQRREAMLAGSDGVRAIPQLHVNGRYIGAAEDLQARVELVLFLVFFLLLFF